MAAFAGRFAFGACAALTARAVFAAAAGRFALAFPPAPARRSPPSGFAASGLAAALRGRAGALVCVPLAAFAAGRRAPAASDFDVVLPLMVSGVPVLPPYDPSPGLSEK